MLHATSLPATTLCTSTTAQTMPVHCLGKVIFKSFILLFFYSTFLSFRTLQQIPTLATNTRWWGRFVFITTLTTLADPTLATNVSQWGHFLYVMTDTTTDPTSLQTQVMGLFFFAMAGDNNVPHPHYKHKLVWLTYLTHDISHMHPTLATNTSRWGHLFCCYHPTVTTSNDLGNRRQL